MWIFSKRSSGISIWNSSHNKSWAPLRPALEARRSISNLEPLVICRIRELATLAGRRWERW